MSISLPFSADICTKTPSISIIMFAELFLFELKYRARRFDTYFYFIALFLFSIISVDFIFEGQLTTLLPNSPIVIARTMGIVSALFLMIVSMIAGTSILRDFTQNSHVLLFSFPFTKAQYLLSRFLGSFVVVVLIFTALPLGMMLIPLLPWHQTSEL
ncbi:MAG: ABC-2 transporter permease [Balneolaceae bacterium]|nr:ABC-2 transporter permease [Balneolaceae bacterium]